MYEPSGPATSARFDIETNDQVNWITAVQFGPTWCGGCTGPTGPVWQLTGSFQWDVKANNWNAASPEPALSLTSLGEPNACIVVDDPINLILHSNVLPDVLTGGMTGAAGVTGTGLLPGEYKHALLMTQGTNTVELLHGQFKLRHGV